MKSKSQFHILGQQDVDLINKETRYQGFFKIDEYSLRHRCFNGDMSRVLSREIFERGDAVCLIPYDPVRNSMVVVEQFRSGALRAGGNPWLIEFIAGMFGKSESPTEVAVREAKEEADLTIEEHTLEHVISYLSSPGGTSEQLHLYVCPIDASSVGGVYGLEEEGEDIKVHELPLDDALSMVNDGTINNGMTIIGIQWLALNHHKLQQKWRTNDPS
ncbi:NUDIX domain-containing protein [Thalassotalea euphylliae]|uniref:NUDIX domain-containing protein n=1 Tax=Thalassotalea euphylliae TaxID=1655234 RepID=UPI0036287228